MHKILAATALALATGLGSAATITPTSYAMPNGSGQAHGGQFNYWDRSYTGSGNTSLDHAALSGGLGDLTDGLVTNLNWFDAENAAGSGPYVGWRTGPGGLGADPVVQFFFGAAQNIDTIRVHADDSAGAGGVNLPSRVLITWAGGTEGRAVIDPDAGSGPSWLVFEGLDISGATSVSLQFIHDNDWVFVDEVMFDGQSTPVPVPATLGLVALGLGALVRRRRA